MLLKIIVNLWVEFSVMLKNIYLLVEFFYWVGVICNKLVFW